MAREFLLPDLGSGLQEAEIVSWHVSEGEEVSTEGILCEVETEKAVIEVPVPFDGVVLSLAVPEGEVVAVGDVLAVIGEAGEAANAPAEPKPETASQGREDTAAEAEEPRPAELPSVVEPVSEPASEPAMALSDRPRAMPGIRKLAREQNIDLESVSGSGKAGRITRADVERTAGAPTETISRRDSTRVEKLSVLRQSIARNMAKAWREIPHCFTRLEVDATWLLESRRVLGEGYGEKVSLEAMLIKAVIPALKEFPRFNATFTEKELFLHQHYHIGIAVDTPDGLIVPVVKDADQATLKELSGRVTDLVQRTVTRRADPSELSGNTFTINNVGALGNVMGTSIIPPGTTAILSAGRAQQKPVVKDGKIVIAPVMELALAFDHRALDGGDVQRFMKRVGANIEQPIRYLARD